jgi:hypothetical protein
VGRPIVPEQSVQLLHLRVLIQSCISMAI